MSFQENDDVPPPPRQGSATVRSEESSNMWPALYAPIAYGHGKSVKWSGGGFDPSQSLENAIAYSRAARVQQAEANCQENQAFELLLQEYGKLQRSSEEAVASLQLSLANVTQERYRSEAEAACLRERLERVERERDELLFKYGHLMEQDMFFKESAAFVDAGPSMVWQPDSHYPGYISQRHEESLFDILTYLSKTDGGMNKMDPAPAVRGDAE